MGASNLVETNYWNNEAKSYQRDQCEQHNYAVEESVIKIVMFALRRFPQGKFDFGRLPRVNSLLSRIEYVWYDMIQKFSPVDELNLSLCQIASAPHCFENVVRFLESVPVEKVDLSHTMLGPHMAIPVFESLLKNKRVKFLKLRHANLDGKAGGNSLASLLRNNNGLLELDISKNQLGSEGVEELVRGLEQNNCLRQLCIDECGLNSDEESLIHSIIARNNRFEKSR